VQQRERPTPATTEASGASRSAWVNTGPDTTARPPSTPIAPITTMPGSRRHRDASPPAAATRVITTNMPTSSTGLSQVPNVVLANSVSACGERRTTASPTAR